MSILLKDQHHWYPALPDDKGTSCIPIFWDIYPAIMLDTQLYFWYPCFCLVSRTPNIYIWYKYEFEKICLKHSKVFIKIVRRVSERQWIWVSGFLLMLDWDRVVRCLHGCLMFIYLYGAMLEVNASVVSCNWESNTKNGSLDGLLGQQFAAVNMSLQ